MTLLYSILLSAVVTVGLLVRERRPCLAIEPFPGPARLLAGVALLVVVLAVTSFAPLRQLFSAGDGPALDDLSFASLFEGHAVLAGFLLLWWGLAGFEAPSRFLRLHPTGAARKLGVGVVAGLGGWAVTIGVMAVVAGLAGLAGGGASTGAATGELGAEEIPEVVRFLVALPVWHRLLLVVSAGVFEEAFFRSYLQPRAGLWLSSLLFTMSHASYGLPAMLIGVLTVSLVLGLLLRAADDVLPCMVAHAVFDGVQLLVVLPAVVGGA